MATWLQPAGLRFLRSLAKNNDRAWFGERKEIFLAEVQAPYFALIEAVNEHMLRYAPEHVRPANKVALRIYRDTRFSADKRPIKEHFGAWWSRAGMKKTSGAGFYMHIGPKDVVIAAGIFMPTPEQLTKMRAYLAENHDEVRRMLQARALRKHMPDAEMDAMKRVPKGYAADHPAEDLLRARRLGVSITLPPEEMLSKDLTKRVTAAFQMAAPLVHALNTPLVKRAPVRAKPLF
ncbi:MAG: DUF2461 domain-containing protein [Acidobacteria bacterium]|nr:DUF2461 domain-containing protein [Acidobacteriota bacterium]